MNIKETVHNIADDLGGLGIQKGDTLMVHSSLKSLGFVPGGPETVIRGFERAIGVAGNLLMPALSLEQKPDIAHEARHTPVSIGTIPEYLRKRAGTVRSVHPTHSVCGIGPDVPELFSKHHLDQTCCGRNSPFNRIMDVGAKIVMLGCGLRCNTTMHALEEYVVPPYLFGEKCDYIIVDQNGRRYTKTYIRHSFKENGIRVWEQRYDRIAELPDCDFIRTGKILQAAVHVIDSAAMKSAVLARLEKDPLFFVERRPGQDGEKTG